MIKNLLSVFMNIQGEHPAIHEPDGAARTSPKRRSLNPRGTKPLQRAELQKRRCFRGSRQAASLDSIVERLYSFQNGGERERGEYIRIGLSDGSSAPRGKSASGGRSERRTFRIE